MRRLLVVCALLAIPSCSDGEADSSTDTRATPFVPVAAYGDRAADGVELVGGTPLGQGVAFGEGLVSREGATEFVHSGGPSPVTTVEQGRAVADAIVLASPPWIQLSLDDYEVTFREAIGPDGDLFAWFDYEARIVTRTGSSRHFSVAVRERDGAATLFRRAP